MKHISNQKNQFKINEQIKSNPISWLEQPDIVKWLNEHNFITIDDVIKRQREIPNDILVRIKAKLIFGILI